MMIVIGLCMDITIRYINIIGGILCTLVIPWHSNCINPASFLGVMPTDIITVMFAPAVAVVVCLVYLALSNFVVKKQK